MSNSSLNRQNDTASSVTCSVHHCVTLSQSNRLLSPQCLKTQGCQDDVHVSFAQLLSELNKAGAPYALSVANRLYGEKSYEFVEVCVRVIQYVCCSHIELQRITGTHMNR